MSPWLHRFSLMSYEEQQNALISLINMLPMQHLRLINANLAPMLQRDFLTDLPLELSHHILRYLDVYSLCAVSGVCLAWRRLAADNFLWSYQCEANGWTSDVLDALPVHDEAVRSNVKHMYGLRYKLEANWKQNKCSISRLDGHRKIVFACQLMDNNIVSGSLDTTVKLWDMQLESCIRTFLGHEKAVYCVHVDDDIISSGSADMTVRLWNKHNGECIHVLCGHLGEVCGVWHDKEIVTSVSCDHNVIIWDITHGTLIRTLLGHQDYVICVQFDSSIIVTGGFDNTLRIWRRSLEENIGRVSGVDKVDDCIDVLYGHTAGVKAVSFNDAYIVSSAQDFRILVWSRISFTLLTSCLGHSDVVWSVKLRSDNVILSGSQDKTLRLWDATTGECRAVINAPSSGTIAGLDSDASHIIACSFAKVITIFDFLPKN